MELRTPGNESRAFCGSRVVVLLALLFLGAPVGYTQSTLVFPQMVEGPEASSVLVLINAGSAEDTGQVQFFDSAGQPLELTVEGSQQSSISYTIPPGGFTVIEASGGESLSSGYAQVFSGTAGSRLAGTLRILLGDQEVVFLDAPARREHLVLIEQNESIRTGLAIVNPALEPSNVRLEALNDSGEVVAHQIHLIDAGQQLARFGDQLLVDLPGSFQGLLRASSEQAFSLIGVLQDSTGGLRSLLVSGVDVARPSMPGPDRPGSLGQLFRCPGGSGYR